MAAGEVCVHRPSTTENIFAGKKDLAPMVNDRKAHGLLFPKVSFSPPWRPQATGKTNCPRGTVSL